MALSVVSSYRVIQRVFRMFAAEQNVHLKYVHA